MSSDFISLSPNVVPVYRPLIASICTSKYVMEAAVYISSDLNADECCTTRKNQMESLLYQRVGL